MTTSEVPSCFSDAFTRIDQLLLQFSQLWRANPFPEPELDWQKAYPELSQALLALELDELKQLEQNWSDAYRWFLPFLPQLQDVDQLLEQIAPITETPPLQLAKDQRFLMVGVPGRKWQQIQAFAQAVDASKTGYLDWCCGKGHLARLLCASKGTDAIGLEYNHQLCDAGNQLSQKHHLSVEIHQQDVMAQNVERHFSENRHLVSLHACGDLHLQLMQKAAKHRQPRMTFSPCCYHLIQSDKYQPLSAQAEQSGLTLDKSLLKLAVLETVTAPGRVDRQRRLLKQYRLGFDLLCRKLTGNDGYQSVPSLSPKLLSLGFDGFCLHLAEQTGHEMPEQTDFQCYLDQAIRKTEKIERLELLRKLFRPLLEMWLILDRCLYLQQQNYHVQISRFCHRSLTPRNILIKASLRS